VEGGSSTPKFIVVTSPAFVSLAPFQIVKILLAMVFVLKSAVELF
jgi:hypothetical protein